MPDGNIIILNLYASAWITGFICYPCVFLSQVVNLSIVTSFMGFLHSAVKVNYVKECTRKLNEASEDILDAELS
jgi:hypothetical protein